MERNKEIYRITLTGSLVNFLLLIFKFIAGYLGHSSAMIADALHSLSDFVSDFVTLFFVHMADKPRDAEHQYGHGKFETLGSIIIGLMLFGIGAGFMWESLENIIAFYNGKHLEMPNWWALSAAILSILLKEWLYRYTANSGSKLDSTILAANAWHHRSDAITSIAALFGIGGAMLLGPAWSVLDPIAAAVVSIFIIKMSLNLMKPCFGELMESSLPQKDKSIIIDTILSTNGVSGFHKLRTRRIGPYRAIEAHIIMPGDISLTQAHDLASTVEKRLRDSFGKHTHVILHMEPAGNSEKIS